LEENFIEEKVSDFWTWISTKTVFGLDFAELLDFGSDFDGLRRWTLERIRVYIENVSGLE
jgi:hypothetical protein